MPFEKTDHCFVVCAYGESAYLEECLLSLSIQSVPSRMLIATSTPNGRITELAHQFGLPVCVNQGETGIAADWNFALSCSDSPLVTIAHQDDVYSDRYTEWMLDAMNNAKRPLLYFSDYGEIRDDVFIDDSAMNRVKRILLKPLENRKLQDRNIVKRRVLSLGNPICCPSVTYNMNILPKPIFLSSMRSNLDWEAWERISHLKGEFVYDARIGMYHRVHDESETSVCIADNIRTEEDLNMLKRFWPDSVARLINKAYSKAQLYN